MRALKLILIVVVAAALAWGAWNYAALQNELAELREAQHTPQRQAEEVVIYLVQAEPTDFHLVPVRRQLGGPASPTAALQALLNGPLAHEELFGAVPHTAKLLSLQVEDGLAVADFSQELVTDFNGGALLESYLVKAIVNTLTQFPQIQEVQILVEGEVVESIGGHILISKPLKRTS